MTSEKHQMEKKNIVKIKSLLLSINVSHLDEMQHLREFLTDRDFLIGPVAPSAVNMSKGSRYASSSYLQLEKGQTSSKVLALLTVYTLAPVNADYDGYMFFFFFFHSP